MNRTLLPVALAGLLTSCATNPAPVLPPPANTPQANPGTSAFVDSLLSRMTLEEKVGQMTQVTMGVVAAEGTPQRDSVRLDPAKLRQAIVDYKVGSILNNVSGALTLEGWHDAITRIQNVATKDTRLGIPVLYGIDAVHGVNYTRDATIFPHNLGLAATFDPSLARRAGKITADEVLASSLPWNFAPVLDVGRQPLWPRFYETFGEDPLVAARMGSATIEGMQENDRVAATMKHYLGYSAPQSGLDRTPTVLTERAIREHFLPPFRAAVETGAKTLMVNSGEIDGIPVHASRYWLTDVLRDELGFDGVVVTDWEDVIYLHNRHRVAPTMKDAVRMAVEAGIDMSMTPNDFEFAQLLAELVREGAIPESRIDESVRRILKLKEELALFQSPYPDPSLRDQFATPQAKQAALQAARESITLLKNDKDVLPLRRNARILVTGPAANSLTAQNGGWTYTWQGQDATQLPAEAETVLEAIQARAPNVRFVEGAGFDTVKNIDAAVRAARNADVAVVVLGENAYAETPGNISDLTLPEAQLRLAEAVQATGTPTILVLVEGRPRIVNRIVDDAEGVVMAYWPGMEGGQAVAEVLFGQVNPSGRLPFTYPRYTNALIPYDHKTTEALRSDDGKGPSAFNPQWEFGHGLSYTTFGYSDLRIAQPQVRAGEPVQVQVQVTVRNTGQRPGKEAVLLFTRQHYASITPPVRRLRGFEKVELGPGEARTVTFTLTPEDLSFVGPDGKMVLEPGAFDVMVGGLTDTFQVLGR